MTVEYDEKNQLASDGTTFSPQPQPQFQVFVNKIRTNSFHHKYMNIAKTKKLGDRRWE